MDTKDKRVKREIANNNERRRMQSINAGFQKLKRLLPVNDTQKLSKAAILQHAAEYIEQIQNENLSLRQEQNTLIRGKHPAAHHHSTDNIKLREDISTTTTTTTTTTIKRDDHPHQYHQQSHEQQTQQQLRNLDDLTDQHPITNVVEVISDRMASSSSSPNNSGTTTTSTINNNTTTTNTTSNNNNTKNNNDSQSPACRAQAAIALPLEVPYTSETAMHSDHHHHGLNLGVPKESTPKGQNLNTILQAIVEIEGNRMQFNS